jgi:hypothetical protein
MAVVGIVLSLCPLIHWSSGSRSPGYREQSAQADHPEERPSEFCAESSSSSGPRRSDLVKDQPSDSNGREHGGDRENAVVENLTP